MKLHGGETVKSTKVLYIPQAVKNILSVSMIAYKGDTMGATQEKMTIRKNGVNTIIDAREGKNAIKIFYLKAKM